MKPLTKDEIAELRELAAGGHQDLEEAGQCVPRLLDEVERARALLKRIEWNCGNDEYLCPECGASRYYDKRKHKPTCELAALLPLDSEPSPK